MERGEGLRVPLTMYAALLKLLRLERGCESCEFDWSCGVLVERHWRAKFYEIPCSEELNWIFLLWDTGFCESTNAYGGVPNLEMSCNHAMQAVLFSVWQSIRLIGGVMSLLWANDKEGCDMYRYFYRLRCDLLLVTDVDWLHDFFRLFVSRLIDRKTTCVSVKAVARRPRMVGMPVDLRCSKSSSGQACKNSSRSYRKFHLLPCLLFIFSGRSHMRDNSHDLFQGLEKHTKAHKVTDQCSTA